MAAAAAAEAAEEIKKAAVAEYLAEKAGRAREYARKWRAAHPEYDKRAHQRRREKQRYGKESKTDASIPDIDSQRDAVAAAAGGDPAEAAMLTKLFVEPLVALTVDVEPLPALTVKQTKKKRTISECDIYKEGGDSPPPPSKSIAIEPVPPSLASAISLSPPFVCKVRRHVRLPKETIAKLRMAFMMMQDYPYPTSAEYTDISNAFGVKRTQVMKWFEHRRTKAWIPMRDGTMTYDGYIEHMRKLAPGLPMPDLALLPAVPV